MSLSLATHLGIQALACYLHQIQRWGTHNREAPPSLQAEPAGVHVQGKALLSIWQTWRGSDTCMSSGPEVVGDCSIPQN